MFKITFFIIGLFSIVFGLLLLFIPKLIFFNVNNEINFIVSLRVLGVSLISLQGFGCLSISMKTNRKIYLYRAIMYTTILETLILLYSRLINSSIMFYNDIFLGLLVIISFILIFYYRKNFRDLS